MILLLIPCSGVTRNKKTRKSNFKYNLKRQFKITWILHTWYYCHPSHTPLCPQKKSLFHFSTSQRRSTEYSGPNTEISNTNHAGLQYRSHPSCRAGEEEAFISYYSQEHSGERHTGFVIWACKTQVLEHKAQYRK